MKHGVTAWWLTGFLVSGGILASCGDSQMALAPQAPRNEAGRQADCNVQVSIVANAATLGDKTYSPDPVTIARGATVIWTNNDSIAHTVTAKPDATVFDSGSIAPGATFSHTFNSVGDFDYFCTIHPGMVGKVTVSDSAGVCAAPSTSPSGRPSGSPGTSPSTVPSTVPSGGPSEIPTVLPSVGPTEMPSAMPGMQPNPQLTVTAR